MMPNVELREEFFSQVLAMDAELSRRVAAVHPLCGEELLVRSSHGSGAVWAETADTNPTCLSAASGCAGWPT